MRLFPIDGRHAGACRPLRLRRVLQLLSVLLVGGRPRFLRALPAYAHGGSVFRLHQNSAAADMLKFIVSFGAGVYAGIYAAQNYQVPRVDEPQELWRKVKDFADQYRKSPPGV